MAEASEDDAKIGKDLGYYTDVRETIHPTKKFTSMNLLQMSCVTYPYLLLTSIEAVRGQTPHSDRTLWHCGMDRTLS